MSRQTIEEDENLVETKTEQEIATILRMYNSMPDLLHVGVSLNDIGLVGTLLKTGQVDINRHDKDGKPPIVHAFIRGDKHMLKLLIANGAKDFLLHAAVCLNDISMARELLENGEDIDQYDPNRMTPFHYAVKHFSVDMARFLGENGANTSLLGYSFDN